MSMNLLQILLIAAVVVFVIVRRFAGQPLQSRSFVLPLGLAAYGAYQLSRTHVGGPEVAFVAVEVLLALALGAIRGTTIEIYVRDGHLWQRYRWSTLAMWGASIAARLGLLAAGYAAGLHLPTQSLFVLLGANLLAETAIVGQRAARTGVPFAPGRRRVSA
jgi:hypothetical protein